MKLYYNQIYTMEDGSRAVDARTDRRTVAEINQHWLDRGDPLFPCRVVRVAQAGGGKLKDTAVADKVAMIECLRAEGFTVNNKHRPEAEQW